MLRLFSTLILLLSGFLLLLLKNQHDFDLHVGQPHRARHQVSLTEQVGRSDQHVQVALGSDTGREEVPLQQGSGKLEETSNSGNDFVSFDGIDNYLRASVHPSQPRKKVEILLFDRVEGYLDWWRPEFVNNAKENCSTECIVSQDKSRLSTADGVIFHAPTHDVGGFPAKRQRANQKYIYVTLEQPENSNGKFRDPAYRKNFDLNATYELFSDIPIMTIAPRTAADYHKAKKLAFEEKDGFGEPNAIAAFISNCGGGENGASQRKKIMEDLAKIHPVHSYGGCMQNKKEPALGGKTSNENKRLVLQRYKFYLAFENGVVEDYVSEKVFDGLLAGSLSVYRGAPRIQLFMPSSSPPSILEYGNFSGVQELADYLNYLSNNKQAYEEFFKWKDGEVRMAFDSILNMTAYSYYALCRICAKLAQSGQ